MYKKSVSLINSPKGLEDQNRALYGNFFDKLYGRKTQTPKESVITESLYTEEKHKTANRRYFNIASS